MRFAFYILLFICIAMCGFAEVATWITCMEAGIMILLALILHICAQKSRRIRRKLPLFRNVAACVSVIALVAEEIHVGRGDVDSWLLRCIIDLIFWLFIWRAFDHDTRSKRMQIVILSMLPFAAMGYTLDAVLYLLFLFAYSTAFLVCLSLESFSPPASGATCIRTKRMRRSMLETARYWDLPGFGWRFAGVLSVIFILSFILFFFMPRLSPNVSSVSTASKTADGRFPDIDLARTGDIHLEPTLIFTADIPETIGEAYWRIDVQTRFDGVKWSSGMASEDRSAHDEKHVNWHTLQFTQNWRDWHLPALANTVALRPLEGEKNRKLRLYRNADGLWFRWGWRRSALEGFEFAMDDRDTGEQIPSVAVAENRHVTWPDIRLLFDLMYGRKPHPGRDRPKRQMHRSSMSDAALIWPYSKRDPHYQEIVALAEGITRDAGTNLAKADAVADYLQTHYQYSLQRPASVMPVVAEFLFHRRRGHCELFSSSMVVLLNKVGVPARHVSGFMSSEYHEGRNYVRASHAHSWVEVYDDTTRLWIRFDPTPPSAMHQEVSAWVRFNDWFLTYRSKSLYQWIPQHFFEMMCILAVLLGGSGVLLGFWSWMAMRRGLRMVGFAVSCFAVITMFMVGGMFWGILASLLVIMTLLFAVWRIASLDERFVWHRALSLFKHEARRHHTAFAAYSLEEMWNRSRGRQPDAIHTFFDTAIRALYNEERHETQALWLRFCNHIHIQRLLLAALGQLKQNDNKVCGHYF